MSKSDWVWMPHPAHFILGDRCRFHLATYVNGVVVSTVGELWHDYDSRRAIAESQMRFDPDKQIDMSLKGDAFDAEYMRVFGYDTLGLNRFYETMVFEAVKGSDAECGCCPYIMSRHSGSLDFEGYNTGKEAYEGHLAICERWDAYSAEQIQEKIKEAQDG